MATTSGQLQQSPATPIYILRGHVAPIHALHVFAANLRLVSGDADGWVVIWDLVTKRPVTVWKAHAGAVLEVKGFSLSNGVTEIYTHGRDHKLCVWKIRTEDEAFLDKTLPVDLAQSTASEKGTQPWLLHSLSVNALNFCAFSMTFIDTTEAKSTECAQQSTSAIRQNVLFAVPNALDSGGIDVFHLPSERRLTTIKSDPSVKTGMLMAVSIFISPSGDIFVASAFEDGHVMVFTHKGPLNPASFELSNINSNPWKWNKIYASRPHNQPVLSLDVSPSHDYFISSSADALLIKHPIPSTGSVGFIPTGKYTEDKALKTVNTKHSGQQGLRIRSDGKIFATAGWDSRVRVYSGKTMKELAVLKWHKDGCYAVAFGEVDPPDSQSTSQIVEAERSNGQESTQEETSQEGVPKRSIAAVHLQRFQKIQRTHWLVAGSKDGKISLWDIY
ncbi:ASTRA-associated protein 1 [Penicillium brasilianum]|uniref:ASTRA-associated protein 1 n=1 Tax=Penicillium brasilianum TaxID=104259 RepID=A0A1S9RCL3_PENBI|nr:ASTRA-associated protein 1 [Penicillium brasilianum]